jgi:hypothetical protein
MKMSNGAKGMTRRKLLQLGTINMVCNSLRCLGDSKGLQADHSIQKRNRKVKIWDAKEYGTTIGFELPELPGEVFKIIIPEVISDAIGPIVPYQEKPSSPWEIGENRARCSLRIPSTIQMEAMVVFGEEQIETRVRVTNLSQRRWDKVNANTCFAYYTAPSFDDPQVTRTYLPVDGNWKSISELFAEHDPGDGPITFFSVKGGHRLEDFWICREFIPQRHPQVLSKGCACVVSSDGNWIAGMATDRPAYVFNNRGKPGTGQWRCIHADPLIGTVAPGETAEGTSMIYIFRGTLASFTKRCDA